MQHLVNLRPRKSGLVSTVMLPYAGARGCVEEGSVGILLDPEGLVVARDLVVEESLDLQ